jgi:hypothetical protein
MKIQIDNATLAAIYITAYYGWGVLMWILTKKMSSWIPVFSVFLLSFDKLQDGWWEFVANVVPPAFMTFAICVFAGYIK